MSVEDEELGRQRDLAAFHERFGNPDGLAGVAMLIALCGSVFPALGMTGFFFDFGLDLPTVAAIAAVCCTIAFCLYYTDRRFWFAGILPGLITGPIVTYFTHWYTAERQQLWNVEIMVPVLVGVLPGLLLYYVSLRTLVLAVAGRERRRRQEEPPANEPA
jgi:hypothetical protein